MPHVGVCELTAEAECGFSSCSRTPARIPPDSSDCGAPRHNNYPSELPSGLCRLRHNNKPAPQNAKDRRAAAAYSLPVRSFKQSTILN